MKKLFSILAIAIFLPSFAFANISRSPAEEFIYSPITITLTDGNYLSICNEEVGWGDWKLFAQNNSWQRFLGVETFASTTLSGESVIALPVGDYSVIGSVCCPEYEAPLDNCYWSGSGSIWTILEEAAPAGIFTPPANFFTSSTAYAAEAIKDAAPVWTLIFGIILAIVGINAIIWLVKKAPFAKAK